MLASRSHGLFVSCPKQTKLAMSLKCKTQMIFGSFISKAVQTEASWTFSDLLWVAKIM